MSLVALDGTPLTIMGCPLRRFVPNCSSLTGNAISAANDSLIMIGYIFTEDGASHTIDTTGSSSFGWRCGPSLTFANAGTTVKVGLAAVDTANGPPVRAVNVANAITFDVAAVFTGGGGGITGSAWQTSVPTTGTKTVANGDFLAFAIQMTAKGGSDSLQVQCASQGGIVGVMPTVTTGSSYSNTTQLPNAVITFSDGVRGYFYGGYVASSSTTQTWSSADTTKEYGNLIQLPVPAKAYGVVFNAALFGNTDAILYSDPLGTPSAQKTVSIDLNTIGVASAGPIVVLFPSPYSMSANTPYAAILKPTTSTSIQADFKTYASSAHQSSESGSNGYAINRNTGAFAAQNSSKDRFGIGLLVGAFDSGGGGGSFSVGVIGC
ncbi:hypothetical protein V5279_23640 [Bradyrhizobium sp. 26S5]|uniref:hypothetical protein n=1 Tax=Bradyrhizobium sp. 26S5 TaxID=3139729 RepID=UPI0030CAD902